MRGKTLYWFDHGTVVIGDAEIAGPGRRSAGPAGAEAGVGAEEGAEGGGEGAGPVRNREARGTEPSLT
ncbi:hypothetical protein GCM10010398_44020 [Streptomyces fimbriatus]